ncbi:hypothetical protein SAMN00790413_03568 [Deinococcus hopiensis KR-140]|uniref:Uncharacterized protein n=1 Tax=Deinococcus hopiensis KR-140 TaxID=695939 RepID=A0A1W1UYN9_9DEIO|nr:hypothetical protein SAMN00790413_03568 [Deinococcus hopiensis KR-140]
MTEPDDRCPVCGEATEDMRHVDVERFYQVGDGRAPQLYQRTKFLEVDPQGTYIMRLRRYVGGEVHRFAYSHTDEKGVRHITSAWDPATQPAITLAEQTHYGIPCCKRCRGDFITLFLAWSQGKHVRRDVVEGAAALEDLVPIHEHGAIRHITRGEWSQRQEQRDALAPPRGDSHARSVLVAPRPVPPDIPVPAGAVPHQCAAYARGTGRAGRRTGPCPEPTR